MAGWWRLTEMSSARLAMAAAGTVVAGTFTYLLVSKIRAARNKDDTPNVPPNTLILWQCGRGPYAPSFVPFAVKLETFLRLANIPYETIQSKKQSPKGKYPWMQYNDEVISDSQFCIAYLKKKYEFDANESLTEDKKAVAHAFQRMVDENTYWTWALERWVFDDEKQILLLEFPKPLCQMVSKMVKELTYSQGMGRHTRDEVRSVMKGDLKAISDWLGQKKFLMGERPCEVDCAVFGQLSQMKWHCPTIVSDLVDNTFPNLGQYCERMKERFWPDWEDCITHGGTREALK